MKANETQVGGEHYKRAGKHQHWDFAALNKLRYFDGQITKYVTRWRNKNGLQDLEKALHFCEKLIEITLGDDYPIPHRGRMFGFTEFAVANALGKREGEIVALCVLYSGVDDLRRIRQLIQSLRDEARMDLTNK